MKSRILSILAILSLLVALPAGAATLKLTAPPGSTLPLSLQLPNEGNMTTDAGGTLTYNSANDPGSLDLKGLIGLGWTVSSGTVQITTNGTAVGAGTCQAQPAATVNGVVAAASTCTVSLNAAPVATWQTGIFMVPVATNGTCTVYLCNGTAGSITPAAAVINVKVDF